jgi:CHAD domain-containing protein
MALAATALRETYEQVAALRQRVRRSNTETIHRMRVAFKKFRYVSELLRPLFPRLKVKQLRQMQAYQGLMGDIQDMEVLIAAVKQGLQLALLPVHGLRPLLKELMRRRRGLIDAFLIAVDRLFEFHPDKFAPREQP